MGIVIGAIIIIGISVPYTKANRDLALGLDKQEYYRRYNNGKMRKKER